MANLPSSALIYFHIPDGGDRCTISIDWDADCGIPTKRSTQFALPFSRRRRRPTWLWQRSPLKCRRNRGSSRWCGLNGYKVSALAISLQDSSPSPSTTPPLISTTASTNLGCSVLATFLVFFLSLSLFFSSGNASSSFVALLFGDVAVNKGSRMAFVNSANDEQW